MCLKELETKINSNFKRFQISNNSDCIEITDSFIEIRISLVNNYYCVEGTDPEKDGFEHIVQSQEDVVSIIEDEIIYNF